MFKPWYTSAQCILMLALLLGTGLASAQNLPDFTVLVEENVPAIVHVSTSRPVDERTGEQRQGMEEFLRYFYGDQLPELNRPPARPERGASGSGFIISDDGLIVTNHHVIEGAETITITLNDHREFIATVIGSDTNSDLALVKIAATGLPAVTMGSSSRLKVGEWVLAIGSPFGLQYSVTAGIISYMGRSLPTGGRNYVSYIQTDVAINPGHSGGPLINMAGEVIGINSQIFTNSGGSIGLSFAIPVDIARNVISQLRDQGKVERGWLGVGYEDVSQSHAQSIKLDLPHGALVNRIIDDSPAQEAGIMPGDIVVAVDGQAVRTGADLPYLVGLLQPSTLVTLRVLREGRESDFPLTLGSLDSMVLVAASDRLEDSRSGLQLRALEADELAASGLDHGLMVLDARGAAEAARLQQGDIILSINLVDLASPEEFERVLAVLPAGRAIPLLVLRDGQQDFHTLLLPE